MESPQIVLEPARDRETNVSQHRKDSEVFKEMKQVSLQRNEFLEGKELIFVEYLLYICIMLPHSKWELLILFIN